MLLYNVEPMSRSELLFSLAELIKDSVINFDDLKEFSDNLQDAVKFFFNGRETYELGKAFYFKNTSTRS